MKPKNPSTNPGLHIKSNIKPPARIPSFNNHRKVNDVSPKPKKTSSKVKNDSNNVSIGSSELLADTGEYNSINNTNKANIAENLKSLSHILTKKSTNVKKQWEIDHVYTFKASTESTFCLDSDIMRYLIAQKDEEIKSLKAMIDQLLSKSPYNIHDHSLNRPTDIDNTIFAFEEEKIGLESRLSEVNKELLCKDKEIEEKDEAMDRLMSKFNTLENEMQESNKQLSTVKEDYTKVKTQNNELCFYMNKIETSIFRLFDVINDFLEELGISRIEKYYSEDINCFIVHIIDNIALRANIRQQNILHIGTQTDHLSNSGALIASKRSEICYSHSATSQKKNNSNKPTNFANGQTLANRDDFLSMLKDINKLKNNINKIEKYVEIDTSFKLDEKKDLNLNN